MKKTILLYFILLFFSNTTLEAHPGIGLVYDGDQYIYYTDLAAIWKVDINTGKQEKFIPNIHTHELCLDQNKNLYGEHYWYIQSNQQFKNYIWRYENDKGLEKIRADQIGENENFSFVRNQNFDSYLFRKKGEQYEIVKQDTFREQILYTGKFQDIRWRYTDHKGNLFFVDHTKLYQLNQEGELTLLVKDLSCNRFPFNFVKPKHEVYGIWTDKDQNIYVAIYGGRLVKKITPDGKTQKWLRTAFFWSPTNGVFDKDQNLWLLESKISGATRIRKIEKSELGTYHYVYDFIEYGGLLLSFSLLVAYLYYKRKTLGPKLQPS